MHGLSRCAFAALAICASASAAMAAGPVNIQDPKTPDAMANVDEGGRLAVQKVPPSSFFHSLSGLGGTTCVLVAAAPSGKALVARQIRVLTLRIPAASAIISFYTTADCSGPVVALDLPLHLGQSFMTFDPGLAIPEGTGIYAVGNGGTTRRFSAEMFVDGYTVPPSVAPAR